MTDVLFSARLQHIIATSVDGLDGVDRAERVAWCQRTGQHGVRVLDDGPDGIRLVWGGRLLAVVDRDVFDEEAYLEPLGAQRMPDIPDDVRDLS